MSRVGTATVVLLRLTETGDTFSSRLQIGIGRTFVHQEMKPAWNLRRVRDVQHLLGRGDLLAAIGLRGEGCGRIAGRQIDVLGDEHESFVENSLCGMCLVNSAIGRAPFSETVAGLIEVTLKPDVPSTVTRTRSRCDVSITRARAG